MTKKIVVAVFVIDDEDKDAKPEFYEETSLNVVDASRVTALEQLYSWTAENVIKARLKSLGL